MRIGAIRSPLKTRSSGDDRDLEAQISGLAAQLSAMRVIIDDLNVSIVWLDRESRVKFINCAFRRFWRAPDEMAKSNVTFAHLIYHGRGITHPVSHDRLGDYIAKQMDLIRTGEEGPLQIRFADGAILQIQMQGAARRRPAPNLRQCRRADAAGRCALTARLRRRNNRPEQSSAFSRACQK